MQVKIVDSAREPLLRRRLAVLRCEQRDEDQVFLAHFALEQQLDCRLHCDAGRDDGIHEDNAALINVSHKSRVQNLLIIVDENFADTNRTTIGICFLTDQCVQLAKCTNLQHARSEASIVSPLK